MITDLAIATYVHNVEENSCWSYRCFSIVYHHLCLACLQTTMARSCYLALLAITLHFSQCAFTFWLGILQVQSHPRMPFMYTCLVYSSQTINKLDCSGYRHFGQHATLFEVFVSCKSKWCALPVANRRGSVLPDCTINDATWQHWKWLPKMRQSDWSKVSLYQ